MDTAFLNRVLDFAVSIQQIPAPTFAEALRGSFVQQQFTAEGLCDVGQDEVGNVYARLPGSGSAGPLVVSAHLDTVFPLETDLGVRREADKIFGPGIGDNSLGVAGLFGLLWALRQRAIRLPGDLWLVANVGEEGLGDLRGMRAVVERFKRQALAYVILEGMSLGQIYHRALAVKRFRISVHTQGGHSWVNFGRPSAIHELAALIQKLTGMQLPTRPRTTLNVGVVKGGMTVNTIAAWAEMELDLRSESERTLDALSGQVEDLVAAARRPEVEVTTEIIGHRPAGRLATNHALVQLARYSLEAQGIQASLGIGSTDANIPLSQGLPAVCIGLSGGGNAHTLEEFIDKAPLVKGLEQLLALVAGAHRALA